MAIDAKILKGAFAPFAQVKKRGTVEVDLGKVAAAVLDATSSIAKADDPEAALALLEKGVADIDTFLGTCEATDDGVVAPGGEVAESFAKGKSWDGPPPWLKKPGKKPEGEEEDEEKGKKKKAASSTAKGEGEGAEEVAKAEGDDEWPVDLSPRKGPVMRSERLTKGERPIPARSGSHRTNDKYQRARDRAMGRGDDRSTIE